MDKTKICVDASVFLVIPMLILLLPLPWVVAWFASVAVHELFHYYALKLIGCRVFTLFIGLNGAKMETEQLSPWKEVICSLAGPLGGFCLTFCSSIFPALAICGFLQSVYNMIPIYPLDGGRVVRGVLVQCFKDQTARKIQRAIEVVFVIVSHLLGLFTWFYLNLGPVLEIVAATVTVKNIKTPCKECLKRYNIKNAL